MEEVTQSVLSRSGEESPVLGWPNHRSEYANPINPMMLSASTEDITSKKRETLGSTDSGYAENKNMSNSGAQFTSFSLSLCVSLDLLTWSQRICIDMIYLFYE